MNHAQSAVLQDFFRHLEIAAANASLYSLEHQQVGRMCQGALENFEEAVGSDQGISIMLVDDQIIVDGVPLARSMYLDRFAQQLKARGVGHLKLLKGVTASDLVYLAGILSRGGDAKTEIRSTDKLRFGQVQVRLGENPDDSAAEGPRILPRMDALSAKELESFMALYEGVKRHQKLDMSGISDVVTGFIGAFQQVADPMLAIAPLRAMDEYTFTHSTNVCILNLAQAMSLGVEGELLHDIGIAAMLHDIGKLFVPEEILNKTGKFTDEEWEIIKQHPVKGALSLLDTPGVPRLAVVTAYEHHLKYNLTGYPKVPQGWQQSLCSHMTTVSDVFDALRTKRVYRAAMEFEEIAGIMAGMAGTDLHPVLTHNFLALLKKMEGAKAKEGG